MRAVQNGKFPVSNQPSEFCRAPLQILPHGFFVGKLVKAPERDLRSLTIETGIQNSGLGLALLFNSKIFDPNIWTDMTGMVLIAALWGVWHIVSGLTVATIFKRRKLEKGA